MSNYTILHYATAYAKDRIPAIYFEAENGDGVLMPVRPKK